MGIDFNRFVDLPQSLSKHLCCGICHQILDNAVITSCGHSFCELCIKQTIESNHLSCAECRQRLKKCNQVLDDEEPYYMICEYSFARNYKINGIISELTIKCDFEFNGCPQTVQVGLLVEHLKACPNRFCKICGFIAGPINQHDCFELMKSDRDEWKRIAIKAEEENQRLKTRIVVLQEEHAYCDFQGDNLLQ